MISITKDKIEEFFLTMLDSCTCNYTSYLNMPNNDGFSYCLKEIIHTLENNIKNNVNNNYVKQLICNFYTYMQGDIVFKEVDKIQYSKLMLNLKQYSEGDKTSKQEQFTYFEHLYRVYRFCYKEKLYKIIIDSYDRPKNKYDDYFKIFSCFISELLADGVSYKYLGYILSQYRNDKFTSFKEFLEYLNYGNKDGFDIYIPIKNVLDKNIEYLRSNGQQIELIEGKHYCKVYYNKCIDFYLIIRHNMTRIESMFNMLRLYSKSIIDFAMDDKIIIESQYFKEKVYITFSEIICYKGITPFYKHLDMTLASLEKLKDIDKYLYHKVLNIISYAEKDKDIMNQSSYVDNWISLETLCSLSGRKTGYDAVEFVLPSILAAKLISSNLTDLLKKSYIGKNKILLEKFVQNSNDGIIDLGSINNIYYQYSICNYYETLRDMSKLRKKFEEVEKRVRLDLLRIYMLRNEYVHESNVHAFVSMQQIKLKNLLSLALDEFFKMLNRRINSEYSELGLNYEIFTQLLNRSEVREIAFKMLLDKNCKVGGNISLNTTIENENVEKHEFIFNVIKGNMNLLKKYIPASEY